jgi:hypothetical protein
MMEIEGFYLYIFFSVLFSASFPLFSPPFFLLILVWIYTQRIGIWFKGLCNVCRDKKGRKVLELLVGV